MTILVGIFKPSMPNTSTIEGIEGIKPRTTQIKNGIAMAMPSTLDTFLMPSSKGLRLFTLSLTTIRIDLNQVKVFGFGFCAYRSSSPIQNQRPDPARLLNPGAFSSFQITEPSLWMAIQASIFFPTLIGSTFQNMMKGVPSFL